jgi:biopolymer transport protein TolR
MPAMASRGKGRRTINEINMVPFIDVMLVLLIIFMVTAPMLTPGMVDVPKVGKGKTVPKVVAQVVVAKDGSVQLKTPESTRTLSQREVGELALRWQKQQDANDVAPVIITADKEVPYDAVMKTLDSLQKAGVQRVGLSVKRGN